MSDLKQPQTVAAPTGFDAPFTDDMTVFSGGQQRVPMTERPFLRLIKAYIPKAVNKDERVVAAEDRLKSLYSDQADAAQEAAQTAYDAAMQGPIDRVSAAEKAFEEAKAAAANLSKTKKQIYQDAYSEALDDTIEDQRAALKQAIEDAKADANSDATSGRTQGAAAANEVIGDNGDIDMAAMRAQLKARREAMQSQRAAKAQAVIDAERALQEFEEAHAADIEFAESFAKRVSEAKVTALQTAKTDTKAELVAARAALKTADLDAKAAAAKAADVAEARFTDQIEDAALAVDQAKETVAAELETERTAAVKGFKNAPPNKFTLALNRGAELFNKVVLAVRGGLPGIVQGMKDGYNSFNSDHTKAAKTIEALEGTPGQAIDALGGFNRHEAADIQGKMVALAKANDSINLHAISTKAELHKALSESGVTQGDLLKAGEDLDKGRQLPFGVPGTGQIAAKFGLVHANKAHSIVTAQAGQQLINLADNLGRDAGPDVAAVTAGEVIARMRREPAMNIATKGPISTEVNDARVSAASALQLGKVVDGLIAIGPELTQSLGFSEIKRDLAALGKSAITEAKSNLQLEDKSSLAGDLNRVSRRTRAPEADQSSVARVAQFIEQSINHLGQRDKSPISAADASALRALANANLGAANRIFEARAERAQMRFDRPEPTFSANAR